jgi:hypothetical protein
LAVGRYAVSTREWIRLILNIACIVKILLTAGDVSVSVGD